MVAVLPGVVNIAPLNMAVYVEIKLNALMNLGCLFGNRLQGVKYRR